MGIVTTGLLVVNSLLLLVIIRTYQAYLPWIVNEIRVLQAIQIFVPIIMILAEFWVYDRIVDWWDRRGEKQDRLFEP
jgi:hypothetical protein